MNAFHERTDDYNQSREKKSSMAVEFLQILLYSTCVCANMAQILRKKDTITVDDMKKRG